MLQWPSPQDTLRWCANSMMDRGYVCLFWWPGKGKQRVVFQNLFISTPIWMGKIMCAKRHRSVVLGNQSHRKTCTNDDIDDFTLRFPPHPRSFSEKMVIRDRSFPYMIGFRQLFRLMGGVYKSGFFTIDEVLCGGEVWQVFAHVEARSSHRGFWLLWCLCLLPFHHLPNGAEHGERFHQDQGRGVTHAGSMVGWLDGLDGGLENHLTPATCNW